MAEFTLGELAERLQCELRGDGELSISALAPLPTAQPGHISFLSDKRYRQDLQSSNASAVIVRPELADDVNGACLISDNPYLSYARASQLFDDAIGWGEGIHASAVVPASATVHPSAKIGPNCNIGEQVVIGAGSVIGAGCSIGAETVIGDDCLFQANVTVYHKVRIGNQVTVHSNSVLGADGFGFAPSREGWIKIAQLGSLVVGDRVEIGACTTIDRGALDDTVISDGVIIDNQVMIAHNCRIGENTAIAGCVGIAGSTTVGKNCTIAGGVGLAGHMTIADNVHLTGMTLVTKSITEPGSYSSGTGTMDTRSWRKSAVRFSQLDDLYKRLLELEKRVK